MKRLSDEEKEVLAGWMEMPVSRVSEFADLLYEQKEKGRRILNSTELDGVDDYFRERENNWYFYPNWKMLVESEADQGPDARLTEEECKDQLGKEIFALSDGWYAQTVY